MKIFVAVFLIMAVPSPNWCVPALENLVDVSEADTDRDGTGPSDEHPTMPNIGYLFRGYNLMFGNPLPTEGATIDPGFRQPIFKAAYKSHKVTPDNRYIQPDGTSIQDCGGSCSMSFQTKEIMDAKSYQSSLENKVSASVGASYGGFSAAFSASASFKEVQERTSKTSSKFTQSAATCCSYLSQLLNYDKPPLTDNFINALKVLNEQPAEFAKSQGAYFDFIQTFGTHYIREATLGALFGQQSEISNEAWTSMKESGRSISAEAEASGYGVAVSAGYMNDKQKKQASEFAKSSTKQKKFTIGSPPPADGNVATWVQQSHTSPAPMSLKIAPITDIFKFKVEGVDVSKAVQGNLQKALDGYCNWLITAQKNHTTITTCSEPKSSTKTVTPIRNFLRIAYTSDDTKGCLSEDYENHAGVSLEQCKHLCSTAVHCRSIDYLAKPNRWNDNYCYLSYYNQLTKTLTSPCATADRSNTVYLEKKGPEIAYTPEVKGCISGENDWTYDDIESLEKCKLLCSTYWDCRSIEYLPKEENYFGKKYCYLSKNTRHTKSAAFQTPCAGHYYTMVYHEKLL